MRQMVLVCDDSCNSFSSSPPPPHLASPSSTGVSTVGFLCVVQLSQRGALGSGWWVSNIYTEAKHTDDSEILPIFLNVTPTNLS